MNFKLFLALVLMVFLNGAVYAQAKSKSKVNHRKRVTAEIEYGTASFYHDKFVGRPTANGELFSQKKLTAAHNSLPLGTWVEVTNLSNSKTVIVRINDRLHRNNPRLLDLSGAAAEQLGIRADSLIHVKVKVLDKKKRHKKRKSKQ
jgi:rare lipoprotein A